ncbi:MAG TPA: hypothetical protein VHG32_02255 [Thermoanaerobaculia bacterium]|jgi:hypothetical protein|nr:hypothetical protein [Thermoanaerobaculia bacterium]
MSPSLPTRPALPAGLPAARLAAARPAAARIARLACLALLAGLAAAAAPAAATPYDVGERLLFTGVVTDVGGKPLPGVQVALEAVRHAFSLRDFRRAERDSRRVSALTDAQGHYSIEWPWDDYFNRFQVLAGVVVRHGREDRLEVLEREDVTARVIAGSPIALAIVIHDRAFVDRWRDFMASVRSADERRVYEEMGAPDDVKRVNYAGRQEDAEVSWWYFAAGKVYRFNAGRLDQVERFDPVQPVQRF